MSSQSLSSRLRALENSCKQTLRQIQTLSNWAQKPGSDGTSRSDLADEIHQLLKEQEDSLEILRQELDETPVSFGGGWVGGGSVLRHDNEEDQERERNSTAVARLGEDLKSAHRAFRQAQLKSKRSEDAARQKERDELFARRGTDSETRVSTRRQGQGPLTQDELAINAANDVTASLQRMHRLMEGNLQQSEYAQQVLTESSEALAGLSENYSGVDGMLKSSRSLASQLFRSNKSDTWYLTTAFYMICATVAWLVFRRILYGPLWWLVYQPFRWIWWICATTLSSVGIFGGTKQTVSAVSSQREVTSGFNAQGRPTFQPGAFRWMEVKAKGAGWGGPAQPPKQDDSMVEQIGKMAAESREDAGSGGTNIDDISNEERRQQEEMPRNPKKRMMEQEDTRVRDEL